ncbi:MAG: hypothetical protein ACFFFC_00525 [Candidatus Thorarchaeota archaeon]
MSDCNKLPMLEALICERKLWNSGAPALIQKASMKKILNALEQEHDQMTIGKIDAYQNGLIVGAMKLIKGLLNKEKYNNSVIERILKND